MMLPFPHGNERTAPLGALVGVNLIYPHFHYITHISIGQVDDRAGPEEDCGRCYRAGSSGRRRP